MRLPHPAHLVQFFETHGAFVDAAARFLRDRIESGATCVVVVTPAHQDELVAQLRSMGLDPAALAAAYRYIAIDAHNALESFMSDGGPDPQRFHENIGLLIRQAASSGQPVHILGEMASVLASEGRVQAAIRLEELWNELSGYHSFNLLCVYQLETFADAPRSRALLRAMHGHVVEDEV